MTVPIETAPGEEFQFDWSDCNRWASRWGWEHELHCFGAVLCWSRIKHWWFSPSIAQAHTLEGLVGFFEAVEGVAAVGRTDRMGCLGRSRGKAFSWHPGVGVRPPLRPGLQGVRRPRRGPQGKGGAAFRDLKGGFLPEMDLDPPADVAELNRRVGPWLATYVHAVARRSTGVAPEVRFGAEKPLLGPLPPTRFDTARREPRRVGRVPLVEWDGVFYSAPPEAAGQLVEARAAVDSGLLQLRLGGRLVAEHRIVAAGATPSGCPSTGPRRRRSPWAATDVAICARCPPSPPWRGATWSWARATTTSRSPTSPCSSRSARTPDIDPGPEIAATARTEDGFGGFGCFGGLR